MRIIFLSILTMLVVGCSSMPKGDQFSSLIENTEMDKAQLYIYRPAVYYGKAITYPINLDSKHIADLGENGYFTINVEAGSHEILSNTQSIDHSFKFDAKGGKRYFLRLKTNVKPALCFCTSLEFESVSENSAMHELKNTRLEVERVFYGK